MAFNAVFTSCEEGMHAFPSGALLAMQPKLFWMGGDDPYYNTTILYGPWNVPGANIGHTAAQFRDRVHAMFSKVGWREVLARRNAGEMLISWAGGDDHRWADSADHSLVSANTGGTDGQGIHAVTQADVNAVATAWYDGHRLLGNTYWDYPTAASLNSYNGDVPPAPGQAGLPMPASVFPIIYHTIDMDIGGNVGGKHVRFIVPDLITYRSQVDSTDNASKRMMGVTQEAWFLAAVRDAWAQGFQHVFVLSSKKLFNKDANGRYGAGENSETWGQFSTERDRIFGTLHNEGIRPITISGDRHTPQVTRRTVAEHGAAFDCLDVLACPTGVINNDSGQGDVFGSQWMRSAASIHENVFVSAEFEADGYVRLSVRDARKGLKRWSCRVAPRSNAPIYD